MDNANVKAVESYINSLKEKDLSKAPLADGVLFEDPVAGKLQGAEAARQFLSNFLPAINDVIIKQHITEGEYVATIWDADTAFGIIPIFECFRVQEGLITEAKGFFDPRPITDKG